MAIGSLKGVMSMVLDQRRKQPRLQLRYGTEAAEKHRLFVPE
jgi:hypothetical protein